MAVKVMVAPAIANGGIEKSTRSARRAPGAQAPKPKRRRSSVYDADGNEVFITLLCLKCHKMRPLSQFGLRKMADGAIRNQPWCRACRSAAGAEKPRRGEAAETAEPSAAAAPIAELGAAAAPPASAGAVTPQAQAPVRRPGAIAAEVAAALAAGLRR
ncbi:MAG TPA: hypothetical protein VF841_01605 [Anaeromyxobacter sp.]